MEARVCLHCGGGDPGPHPSGTAPSSPGKGSCRGGVLAGTRPRPGGWAGRRVGGTREGVGHTCASEDTARTFRGQLIITYSSQTLRAQCSISFILHNSSVKLMLQNSSRWGIEWAVVKDTIYLRILGSLIKSGMCSERGLISGLLLVLIVDSLHYYYYSESCP